MAGCMISRKVIGPSERPMRSSHPRLSASPTIHLPGWAPLRLAGTSQMGLGLAVGDIARISQHVLDSVPEPLSRCKRRDRFVRRAG